MNRLAALIGLLTIAAAILDWDWFFNSSRAKFFVDRFGRNGARTFYVVLGTAIIFISFLISPP